MSTPKICLEAKYADLLLEVVEDALYRVAISMEEYKGGPMTSERKQLVRKQEALDKLQHHILTNLGQRG